MNQFAKKLYKLENSREDIMELKTLAESIPESSKQVNDLIVASFKTV